MPDLYLRSLPDKGNNPLLLRSGFVEGIVGVCSGSQPVQTGTGTGTVEAPTIPKVISVRDERASTWAGSGNPHTTYNQAIITSMMERGVMELTGQATAAAAWAALIPYESGQIVALKLNFNNADLYNDETWTQDRYMNPSAEVVRAIIAGLNSIGVPSSSIWLCDPSRMIHDTFRARIDNPAVEFYCSATCVPGSRENITLATFPAADSPYATVSALSSSVNYSVRPAQIFVDAAHIINVPMLKGHGGTSISLGLKNNFGSIFIDNAQGDSPLHEYTYIAGANYDGLNYNLLADLNNNPIFKNKTRLVVGDAMIGHPTSNYADPVLFSSFGNEAPKTLFLGKDVLALDSVMFDYLARECTAISATARNDDILTYAEGIGLGTFQHWNNSTDREYTDIAYTEIDSTNDGVTGVCSGSQPVQTGTGTGTVEAPETPEVTGVCSGSQPVQTGTGEGSVLPPPVTGTSTGSQPVQTGTGEASYTPPPVTGTCEGSQPLQNGTGSGVVSAPGTITGICSGSQPVQTGEGFGTVEAPEPVVGVCEGSQPVQTGTGTGIANYSGAVTGVSSGEQPAQTGTGFGNIFTVRLPRISRITITGKTHSVELAGKTHRITMEAL